MTSPEFMLAAWDWFMLLAGYAILLLVVSFAFALIVSSFCKLLRAFCYVFTGRFDEIWRDPPCERKECCRNVIEDISL